MSFIFYAGGAVALISTLLVILQTNVVHALIYLVLSLLAVAVVFFSLGAPFVALLEAIVYAGAIMVLFLFVLMLLSLRDEGPSFIRWSVGKVLAVVISFGIWVQLALVLGQHNPEALVPQIVSSGEEIDSIKLIGQLLFTEYLLPFEAISLLLLVAVIGAVVIAKRRYPRSSS